jgi:membrane fusion protein (multidrug efflux system)
MKTGLCLAAGVLALSSISCKSGDKASAASIMPRAGVAVMVAGLEDVPIYKDYAAETFARDMVEVRGRVDGFLEKRLFETGTDVKAGQELYVLDLRPYEAAVAKAKGDLDQSQATLEFAKRQVALAQAEADLAQAEANLMKARQDVERLQPLVKEEAAPQQDLDNALASLQANQANVKAKKANVEQVRLSTRAQIETATGQVESHRALLQTAELSLEYARIRAPISGRIGDSRIQVGGLVTANSAQPLTTIVPLDPIWVRFKISEAEYLAFKRKDQEEARQEPLRLILANDTVHPYAGRFEGTVNQVDSKTGTLEVQATFPNPQRTILPGQFGRIRRKISEKKGVILIPQRAIQEMQGLQTVLTVGPGNKVLARSVVTGDQVDQRWVIEQGLRPGDRVIVEGLQKARPGAVVNPKPYRKPATEK